MSEPIDLGSASTSGTREPSRHKGSDGACSMRPSVIIPCRNVGRTIGEQLQALVCQRYAGEFEVVVVDDGSTDDTVEVAKQYVDRIPGLRIVNNANPTNVARARNVGIAEASGDVLLFCDGDDVVSHDWLRAMVDVAHGATVLAAGRSELRLLNPDWTRRARGLDQQHGLLEWDEYLPHAGGGNLAVSRDTLDRIGLFDESYALRLNEAADFCWRAQLAGVPLVFVPAGVIHIRLRSTLRGQFRQALGWGECSVALHRKFSAHGLPPPKRLRGMFAWLRLPVRLIGVRDRGALAKWLHLAGWKAGRAIGSVRYGYFAP
jgi:glycosyltransferase involved in cell wall biosynthesis